MKLWIRSGFRPFGLEGADWEEIDVETFEKGRLLAKEMARREYDQYAGVVGVRTHDQIIAEEQVTLADAETIYTQEREDSILYEVQARNPKAVPLDLFDSDYGSRQDDLDAAFAASRYSGGYGNYGGYGDYGAYNSDVDGDDFTPEIEAEIAAEEAERASKLEKSA